MKLFKKESKIEKEEYFSFRVEGIYEHKNDELFVLGIVDGIIQKLDSLFLIGPYGYEEKVEIQEWIEVDSKQNYYALLIDQCFQEEIDQGYIFTNKNNHLASSREEVYNPYLQFLLDQVNRQHYDYLDILFEQLATRAYFLAVFDYQDFPIYQINDKKYYPIYTSQLEMNKDQKCKNKKGSVYSFDDYSRMCLNQDKLDGIIINPYHKERSIVLNKDVIQHIRTIKEKNIKTYAKAKHTNICVGRPLTDPKLIPSLVQENGEFCSSREIRSRKEDTVVIEEAEMEIEAQYLRFKEITGKDPDYFECHAVISQNFFIALRNVAKKYGLFYENVVFDQEFEKENNIYGIAMAKLNEQMLYDPKEYIENSLEFIRNHDVSVMVFHPGYLDQYILTHSSFTLIRAMECDFLCSSWLKDWLKEYQIELTDFRKVKNA